MITEDMQNMPNGLLFNWLFDLIAHLAFDAILCLACAHHSLDDATLRFACAHHTHVVDQGLSRTCRRFILTRFPFLC